MKDYVEVKYNGIKYCVCRYRYNGEDKLFVVDAEDIQKLFDINLHWYAMSSYVGCICQKKTYYVHNVVMEKKRGGGKGQKYTIDHINRIEKDNRKCNLRLVSQAEQNENRTKQTRWVELPENCGIDADEIPRCMWYDKKRERFAIQIVKDGVPLIKQSLTCCSSVSLRARFERSKKILIDMHKTNPELFEGKNLLENYSVETLKLRKEYNAILELSGYDCVIKNKVVVPKHKVLTVNTDGLTPEEVQFVLNDIPRGKGRNETSKLPIECGITPDMLPPYCYYRPAGGPRGDAFIIERHPKFPADKRSISTTGSKSVSTIDKFKKLLEMLGQVEDVDPFKHYKHLYDKIIESEPIKKSSAKKAVKKSEEKIEVKVVEKTSGTKPDKKTSEIKTDKKTETKTDKKTEIKTDKKKSSIKKYHGSKTSKTKNKSVKKISSNK